MPIKTGPAECGSCSGLGGGWAQMAVSRANSPVLVGAQAQSEQQLRVKDFNPNSATE